MTTFNISVEAMYGAGDVAGLLTMYSRAELAKIAGADLGLALDMENLGAAEIAAAIVEGAEDVDSEDDTTPAAQPAPKPSPYSDYTNLPGFEGRNVVSELAAVMAAAAQEAAVKFARENAGTAFGRQLVEACDGEESVTYLAEELADYALGCVESAITWCEYNDANDGR